MIDIFRYLQTIAEDLAPTGNARVAAAVTYKNKIVGIGVNSLKTHPLQARYADNPYRIHLHAEVAAVVNARRRVDLEQFGDCVLWVARVKWCEDHFELGLAKPCGGCQRFIDVIGIGDVKWTT